MKRVTLTLLTVATALLILPALLMEFYLYVLAVTIVSGAGMVALHTGWQSKHLNMLLIAGSLMSVLALFLGIHPLFAIISITLFIYAWNHGHRFGHFDRSPVESRAKQRFIAQALVFSLVPSVVIAVVLSIFLYVRFQLTFGLGLGLSVIAFLLIAMFVWLANMPSQGTD